MRVTSNFVKLILNGIWKITGREPALSLSVTSSCSRTEDASGTSIYQAMEEHGFRCAYFSVTPAAGIIESCPIF